MRICLISVEIFAWGKYGGFGRATRTIGRELAKRGHQVFAVVPRRASQREREVLDGITVLSFPPGNWLSLRRRLREANADVYHSCEPSLGTYLAATALPNRAHVVTCRDPRDRRDWLTEFALPSRSRLRVVANYAYENGPLVRKGVHRADAVFTAAKCLRSKAQAVYRLSVRPGFLPTPIEIPASVEKAIEPTVCFVGRLDRRKRPEAFFSLAAQFPHVRFVAAGASNDPTWDAHLRLQYGALPNLDMRGFVDQFATTELSDILGRAWVIVNTSAREGLPNSMLEAAAHRCAILSAVNPDEFASLFGWHAADGDFAAGLRHLVDQGHWRDRGLAGWRYVAETFETSKSIDSHLEVYRKLVAAVGTRRGG